MGRQLRSHAAIKTRSRRFLHPGRRQKSSRACSRQLIILEQLLPVTTDEVFLPMFPETGSNLTRLSCWPFTGAIVPDPDFPTHNIPRWLGVHLFDGSGAYLFRKLLGLSRRQLGARFRNRQLLETLLRAVNIRNGNEWRGFYALNIDP